LHIYLDGKHGNADAGTFEKSFGNDKSRQLHRRREDGNSQQIPASGDHRHFECYQRHRHHERHDNKINY